MSRSCNILKAQSMGILANLKKILPALTSYNFHLYLKIEKLPGRHQNHHVEVRSLP